MARIADDCASGYRGAACGNPLRPAGPSPRACVPRAFRAFLSSLQQAHAHAGAHTDGSHASVLSHVTSHRDARARACSSSAIASSGIARYAFLPISTRVRAPIIFL
ncbi:hypothetical protein Bcep18194_A4096 [Burkholderia lata]|uniref:Uncharacterized protein n=1 Tax=Burkholderia lata (strain ATCC 17760 / DSM 23089 / LMG 22485 / NCIMB 9086 / R18194 / 383) TaxID=482957 RepID=Q39IM3_BURL3|nr:hypothetical protein Bcep18194_A4096 [Burkholderia lata]